MSAKVLSAAVLGLNCELVEVEADTSKALPGIFIVGLPDKAIDESRERVRSAIRNSGFEVPRSKVTINLAPADLKKVGPAYDLPIALSILLTSHQIFIRNQGQRQLFMGELALDGALRSVNGVLSTCLMARELGISTVFLPTENAAEAALVPELTIFAGDNLALVTAHLTGERLLSPYRKSVQAPAPAAQSVFDLAFIQGQQHAKRALEIAAAGAHNIILSGPPGSGKTLLAKSITTILPIMTQAEALEVTRIYSVAGLLPAEQPLIIQRTFRAPHHTASGVALVGGGSWPRPGEISLAHRGVLFLDEFPEFPRSVLESLRQPLEDGIISVSRASGTLQFPAKFILVAAMNPCPCGYLSDPDQLCRCSPGHIINYQKKISGPLLDRIDLHVEVPKVKFEKLAATQLAESSAVVQQRVQAARDRQQVRFKKFDIITNAEMSSRQVKEVCQVDQTTTGLLRQAVTQLNLSARSYFRILKIARTIADLAGEKHIKLAYVAEALQYRPKVE